MFRIVVAALAIIGLASLFTDVGAGVAIGALAVVPLLLLMKLLFFAGLFSWFLGGSRRRSRSANWSGPWDRDDLRTVMERMGRGRSAAWGRTGSRRPERPSGPSRERFEQWHDLAHARSEVDSWVEDPDVE